MTKGTLLETLAIYFASKGKMLNMREYKQQPDFPVSPNLVIRAFGSWGRVPGKIRKFHPELAAQMTGIEAVASEPEPVQPARSTRAKATVAEPTNE